MLNGIPKERIIAYICSAALVPLLLVLVHLVSGLASANALEDSLERLRCNALSRAREEAPNEALRTSHLGTDRFYLVKHLEGLPLLEDEIAMLQRSLDKQSVASQDSVENRMHFLKTDNHIVLSEGSRQSYSKFQEVTEGFQKPVEINLVDLKRILSLIDGVALGDEDLPQGAPQLIITDFRLEKKSSASAGQTLSLNLKLLKREFTQ